MNSQELRALQEAYSQVYELDEVLDTPQKTQSYAAKNAASAVGAFVRGDTKTLSKRFEGAKRGMKKIEKRKEQKEQTDLYDIILSHLLDEGYAETPEAAEAIMVNMSEDWRESIVEGMGGAKNQDDYEKREEERKEVRDEHLRKYKSGELPFQKQNKADQAQEFLKKHPKK
jgi:hypothetical protein